MDTGLHQKLGGGGGGGYAGITTQRDVTASRAANTVYQNTTGVPMIITASVTGSPSSTTANFYSDSNPAPTTLVAKQLNAQGGTFEYHPVTFVVLAGNYYKFTGSAAMTVQLWIEWF